MLYSGGNISKIIINHFISNGCVVGTHLSPTQIVLLNVPCVYVYADLCFFAQLFYKPIQCIVIKTIADMPANHQNHIRIYIPYIQIFPKAPN